MSKTFELNQMVKTLKNGISFFQVEDQMKCNLTEALSLFSQLDLNIIESARLRKILNVMPDGDIYHSHFNIFVKDIQNKKDITQLPQVIQAVDNKNWDIKGGFFSGNYKEEIKDLFNHAFQNKILDKINASIDYQKQINLNFIQQKYEKDGLTQKQIDDKKQELEQKFERIIKNNTLDLKKLISSYCIFNVEQIETKNNTLLSSTEAAKRVVLDSVMFEQIFDIYFETKKDAEKYNIDYDYCCIYDLPTLKAA